jgi:arylsulfatase A-like enzyme
MSPKSWHIRFALQCAALHWLLMALTQAIAMYSYLTPQISGWDAVVSLAILLPFMQNQAIAISLIVFVLALVFCRHPLACWLFYAGYAVLLIYIVANQLFYEVFRDHFTLSAGEGVRTIDPRLMASSVRQSLNISFAVSAVVVGAGMAWLGWRWVWRRPADVESSGRLGRRTMLVAGVAVALLFFAGWAREESPRYANLQYHPAWVLAADVARPAVHTNLASATTDSDAAAARATLADMQPPAAPDVNPSIAEAIQAIGSQGKRPNVLLIVLESVGSRQLLTDRGLPSPKVTPNLRRLAEHAIVFDSVYSIFPGTARTHAALNTGGSHPTWGSVYDVFIHQYRGPTLATAFGDAGYDTAMFSAMRLDGEYMDRFMRQAGYQTYYDFAEDKDRQRSEHILNSWGAREEVVLPMMERWIDQSAAADRPFFINYLTVATHHPYSVPADYAKPYDDGQDIGKYLNALHYSDAGVGRLIAHLEARGLLDNTIIAVTGDHGESFGQTHPLNMLHKHHIYEENIKSFLIVSHPAIGKGVVSDRVGTIGNIMPTIMAAAGLQIPDVSGRDMTVPSYASMPVFFHKSATPERWGLRNGKWKFMANIQPGPVELYDLSVDPTEQHNLAADYPQRVEAYVALCRQWYMATDKAYVSRLDGFEYNDGRPLTAEDLVQPGPKSMSVGFRDPGQDHRFISHTVIQPAPRPEVCVRWVPFEFDVAVHFTWTAPDGTRHENKQIVSSDWVNSYMPYPGPMPMATGTWRVAARLNDKPVLSTTFEVSEAATGPDIAAASSN